ncbi:MAG: HAMP domain-containing sensor histidine kinase [Hyphomonadaceae bacterium]
MESESPAPRFLAAIGHDLRQPLHALLLYLSALDRRVHDAEARDVLSKADRAAQSLAGMIEGIVQLARLDAGKVEPDIERVSLQSVFDGILAKAPESRADATSLYVHSDPMLLDTIMQQIVANAVAHGGGAPHLSANERGDAVEIIMRDTGPGIAAADHERIFTEFVRLDGASHNGLGIGLTIARKLATLMKHEIEVESVPGGGAAFIIRAPRA